MSVVPAINTKVLLDTAAKHLKIPFVIALKRAFCTMDSCISSS